MVSLYSLIIFFFILVILYSAVSMVLSLAGWLQKKRIGRGAMPEGDSLEVIDRRIDRWKTLTFNAAEALVLFCVTPFVIVCLMIP